MSRTIVRQRTVTALIMQAVILSIVLAIVFLPWGPFTAQAQGTMPPTTTNAATATVASGASITVTVAGSGTAMGGAQEDVVFGTLTPTAWDWWLRLLSAIVVSALGAWAIYRIFAYVTEMQRKYFDVTKDLAKRGLSTQTVLVKATTPLQAAGQFALMTPEGGDQQPPPAPKRLAIKGPNTVIVGMESSDYTAVLLQGDQETTAGEDVSWQVMPEAAATLNKNAGGAVHVTARQPGAFNVVAKVVIDGAVQEVNFPVAAAAPSGGSVSLPFVGEGWGTVVLAVLFGVIIALLGLSRVLSTALVGTLLGALLGYLFGAVSPNLGGGGRPGGGGGGQAGGSAAGSNASGGNASGDAQG